MWCVKSYIGDGEKSGVGGGVELFISLKNPCLPAPTGPRPAKSAISLENHWTGILFDLATPAWQR
jgi:hypothetical protein